MTVSTCKRSATPLTERLDGQTSRASRRRTEPRSRATVRPSRRLSGGPIRQVLKPSRAKASAAESGYDVVRPDRLSLAAAQTLDELVARRRLAHEGEDLRVFGSDSAFAEESRLGALLVGDIKAPALEIDEVVESVAAPDEWALRCTSRHSR